ESKRALRQWFGYVLSGDTSQQKILMTVGPKRSGKSTIARVLTALLGKHNVTGATLASLTKNFGLQSWIDKPLAIIADARIREQQMPVVERLLSISGEDTQPVDRKYKEAIDATLPTRIMLLSNELPKLSDPSGAVASRFVILETRRSFYGHEDRELY